MGSRDGSGSSGRREADATRAVRVALDRPFGFLAPHRHSRLGPAAGRVTDPLPYPEQDGCDGGADADGPFRVAPVAGA
ncbi:hypothetical protein [Streptomyces tricolor]|uniref:hypothetical protein n=1 Tax=Streptomyces tricolor TaxID=68277 RepID=UPI0036EDBB76